TERVLELSSATVPLPVLASSRLLTLPTDTVVLPPLVPIVMLPVMPPDVLPIISVPAVMLVRFVCDKFMLAALLGQTDGRAGQHREDRHRPVAGIGRNRCCPEAQ